MPPNVYEIPPNRNLPQHGVEGAYYAGDWVDLEDCVGTYQPESSKCSQCPTRSTCPRSQTRNAVESKEEVIYDIVIIGAGCIGSAIARELSRYSLKTLLLESADDVSQGATKGNSGIVHAGYDDKPGSLHAKFCWPGNQMFPQLDRELRFGYQLNGSLVLATSEAEVKILDELMERGRKNGVQRLRIIQKKELFEMEPAVNPDAIAALHSPDAGNVIPYEYAIALAENAVDNGVELRIRREVTDITKKGELFEVDVRHWEPKAYVDAREKVEKSADGSGPAGERQGPTDFKKLVDQCSPPVGTGEDSRVEVKDMLTGGSGSWNAVKGVTVGKESVKCRYVINCAGGSSDAIARMIGDDSFEIQPRLGDYILLHRSEGHLTRRTLFPCPDPVLGKGVLVQTTLWGNLILGPTARDMYKPEARDMTPASIQEYILSKCKKLCPSFDATKTIHAFCGARAKSTRGDWIIEPSVKDGSFIHVAGIDSPGLAGSPAIALEVVKLLHEAGLKTPPNESFNPNRAPIITPKFEGARGLKMGPPGLNDSNGTDEEEAKMACNIVCKCEKVTELEVVRALRRSLPIDSSQAIRKRTRAGMGGCQAKPGNYNCECRIKSIIARENNVSVDEVGGRPWPATSTLSERWISDSERKDLAKRASA